MSVAPSRAEQRVILDNIQWSTYTAILSDTGTCRGRMSYDQGVLEIMSPSIEHERIKRLIGRLIEAYTLELNIDMISASSATFRREDLKKGIEADECYYFANLPAVINKTEIDLTVDPPPDLAVEVDISRTSINKLRIYGALGVPEVWRYDGQVLTVHVRNETGAYTTTAQSTILPRFPLAEMPKYLQQAALLSDTRIARSFLSDVRQRRSN